MKTKLSILFSLALATLLCSGYALAGEQEKMVIALKTSDFEIAETDISSLAVGESETIITESGKTIDLLRTADGVEIYVDGELLDMSGMDGHGLHDGSGQNIHKSITIECKVDGESGTDATCDDNMVFFADGDIDIEALHADGEAHQVFIKKIHSQCSSDEEGECADHKLWISDGEDAEFGALHEAGAGHKVIRIRKSHDGEAGLENEHEKVIIIEKD